MLHVLAGHLSRAAVGVVDEHDLLNAQLIDAHDDRAHDSIVVVEDDTARHLDHLHLTVLDAQCLRQHHTQTGVHAGDDKRLARWYSVRDMFLITFADNEALVVL